MRLIDADKMFQKVWDGSDDVYTVNDVLELIDEQPTITSSPWRRVEDLPDFPEEPETRAVQEAEWFVFSVTGATPEQFEALVAFLEQGGYNYALEV